MNPILSGTLNNISDKQTLLDLMDLSLNSRVKFVKYCGDNEVLGTGFFKKEDVNVLFAFECKSGNVLNYWDVICLAVKGMDFNDRLHYYRTVMQIDKRYVIKKLIHGDWDKIKLGYSRGISYGIDTCGLISIYVLDYSVATGKGFAAKLTVSGANKRHEEFALYPILSAKKNLIYNRLFDIHLPKCYFDDKILKDIPLTVYNNACCINFKEKGIANGSMKEQAYEAIFPILLNKAKSRIAVNIVASIGVTATLLVGKRGGRIIYGITRKCIEAHPQKKMYNQFLLDEFRGFFQTMYNCDIEGFLFKECGMTDSLGQPIGVVYFTGKNKL